MTELTKEELKTLQWIEQQQRLKRMAYFDPYPKQSEFFAMGAVKRERLLKAGNQLGKSEAGAFETTCHLTGEYPPWWKGRRWGRAVKGWAAGKTATVTRDVQQGKLCGEPGVEDAFGTGYIPKDAFVDKPSLSRGVTDAYDTIQVRHKSGGISVLRFKSYDQGREKFQGETLDFGWADEEPPADVYSEFLTRVTATKGMVFVTFTPLKGMSEVVIKFLNDPSPDRGVVTMTIFDVKHITPEERATIIAGYPRHEREARSMGTPMFGEGRVWEVEEMNIAKPRLQHIPAHWLKIWGIDFGIDHAFAAALVIWDRDTDRLYVHHTIKIKDALPIQHAHAMKLIGANVPVAWPHDGNNRSKGDGIVLQKHYKDAGLLMLPTHATWPEGGYSVEAGVRELEQRMMTDRFHVNSFCQDWFEEFRMYHRVKGLIVPENDDLISATFKAVMMRRFAKAVVLGSHRNNPRKQVIADGIDFDYF